LDQVGCTDLVHLYNAAALHLSPRNAIQSLLNAILIDLNESIDGLLHDPIEWRHLEAAVKAAYSEKLPEVQAAELHDIFLPHFEVLSRELTDDDLSEKEKAALAKGIRGVLMSVPAFSVDFADYVTTGDPLSVVTKTKEDQAPSVAAGAEKEDLGEKAKTGEDERLAKAEGEQVVRSKEKISQICGTCSSCGKGENIQQEKYQKNKGRQKRKIIKDPDIEFLEYLL
jgi:hypothetical protein